MNARAFSILLLVLAASGCSSRPERYPATDILEVPGFRVAGATDLHQSAGTLQSGTLVYKGKGDLMEVFREYLHAMEEEGWTTTYANFSEDVGTATLRRDRRVAKLTFTQRHDEKITASINVTEAPTVESK